jgi:hypothetical protein
LRNVVFASHRASMELIEPDEFRAFPGKVDRFSTRKGVAIEDLERFPIRHHREGLWIRFSLHWTVVFPARM